MAGEVEEALVSTSIVPGAAGNRGESGGGVESLGGGGVERGSGLQGLSWRR